MHWLLLLVCASFAFIGCSKKEMALLSFGKKSTRLSDFLTCSMIHSTVVYMWSAV
jgi:membrane-anchored protein YejM (alkaline phosphatase superfamily)